MADIIASDAEAIEAAGKLAAELAPGAAERDRTRRLPAAEVERLSESGLTGITVPSRFGGVDVSTATLTEVFRLLATADASIAQIPQSHFVFLEVLRLQGTEEQQAYYFAEALAGKRFANAQSERTSRTVAEDATTLTRQPDGGYLLHGEKFYATGSLFADWLAVRATLAAERAPDELRSEEPALPPKAIAYLRADTPGVTISDDWTGFGQRTTASGTVKLDHIKVTAAQVVPFTPIFAQPTTYGSLAQILHAAIDTGLARAALTEATAQVAKGRPWFEANVDRAADDLLLIQQAGELEVTVRSAESLLREAAAAIECARKNLTDHSAAQASIATAVAKVAAARAAVDASSALFELAGTRAVAESLNLHRLWRDARTHTLHDPVRWKVHHIGRWLLDATQPPRHGLL